MKYLFMFTHNNEDKNHNLFVLSNPKIANNIYMYIYTYIYITPPPPEADNSNQIRWEHGPRARGQSTKHTHTHTHTHTHSFWRQPCTACRSELSKSGLTRVYNEKGNSTSHAHLFPISQHLLAHKHARPFSSELVTHSVEQLHQPELMQLFPPHLPPLTSSDRATESIVRCKSLPSIICATGAAVPAGRTLIS